MLRAPEDRVAAVALPIAQSTPEGPDKVRRGEDWMRSHHNEFAWVQDKPAHSGLDNFVAACSHLAGEGERDLCGWAHDHDGAYRQLPCGPGWAC